MADNQYACSINVTFTGVFPLLWSTCLNITRVAQWINFLLTCGNDKLAKTLREVQQRAYLRAEAVANLIIKQVSVRQSLKDKFNNGVINQIRSVSRGAHYLSVVTLAIALVALIVKIATFVSVNPML